MYVIVTCKPGIYESVAEPSVRVIESYKYLFCGHCKAVFHVMELEQEGYVRITESVPPYTSNKVPTKFLGHYRTLNEARKEIDHLTHFDGLEASLIRFDAAGGVT
ncbi:MAG: ferredoxin [Paralcaligenes sp.]